MIYISYWRCVKTPDGKPSFTKDQMLYPTDLNTFRKEFPRVAVIGYCEVDEDGVVRSETQMTLNEKPPVLPSVPQVQTATNGAVNAQAQRKVPENAQGAVQDQAPKPAGIETTLAPCQMQPPPNPQPVKERVFKSGDSYVKVSGNEVFQLKWKKYVEEEADFDKKVRIVTGEDGKPFAEVCYWDKLDEGNV
jgi:hypothetical protein